MFRMGLGLVKANYLIYMASGMGSSKAVVD